MKRLLLIVFIFQLSVASLFAASPTKTLPIIYVNTDNKQAITDTETQIPASIYIDSVIPDYHPLGSISSPIRGTIKGRGNWTWNGFDKKPYKIKFDVKQKVLGMPNNRHWCLIAAADDYLGFLKMPAGFRISKALGLRWTPRVRPAELVLNGKYQGLYFITEHVRIASNRVKIHEQADNETHPDSITGGWLVEIDNYPEDNRFEFQDNEERIFITPKEPEQLSTQQREYAQNRLYKLISSIKGQSSSLGDRLDLTEAAKYYLVQEIMEDCESYHGSCFLYKDRDSLGVEDKWKFGPVWDFGNAYDRHQETWIYINPTFEQYLIGSLAQHPDFQRELKEQWWIFYHTQKDSVRLKIREFADKIETASKRDAEVWRGTQNYRDNSNFSDVRDRFFRRYDWRIQWLCSQWGEGIKPATWDVEIISEQPSTISKKIIRNGQLFIERGGRLYTIQGLLVE